MTSSPPSKNGDLRTTRCVPVSHNETLDTYVVLEADGSPIEDPHHLQRAQNLLLQELTQEHAAH